MCLPEAGETGNGELVLNGYGVSVLQDKRVLEMNGGDGWLFNNVDVFTATEPYAQKWLR